MSTGLHGRAEMPPVMHEAGTHLKPIRHLYFILTHVDVVLWTENAHIRHLSDTYLWKVAQDLFGAVHFLSQCARMCHHDIKHFNVAIMEGRGAPISRPFDLTAI